MMNPKHSKFTNSPNMDEEDLWQSILTRDHRWDGIFVYAVLSTGIYCCPSCSSRTLYNAGYNSSSRLYNKALLQLGMTPAVYRRGGQGMQIVYTTVNCLFGYLLVAATDKGICAVQMGDTENGVKEAFFNMFNQATIERDDFALSGWVREILDHLDGKHPHLELPLDVRATAFQKRVWLTLQEIPYGSTRTYREIAEAIGQPTAVRAVARACAANPAALLIPCHRVIRSDGNLGGYRWGIERKQVLLHKEAAHASNPEEGYEKDC